MQFWMNHKPLEEVVENVDVSEARLRELVLYNDDYNTFEFVIECLIEICQHDVIQAEQCTYIVHYNGKCAVKTGSFSDLQPMKHALCDKGLSAVIH
ncbi:MAG: ATP-dependent Clp protease adaptor ClpS [Bacteroidetes bacterium]|nr:MAG: ATP-dependent Clp protease adaptor ClpS [Bacteroidota bacterium]REK00075.1 MAG: ATP-dependent Clp protease adaptor ClpS [Bacteroidota bacterium]REK35921.1 MAG: ATP-dependent Clp protease adaptor ClpS [Bacteroidota bacterium]REK50705.1 MAG: ATP-dependent Clp protease adaptor ClpS [Bacteroidota bacterium]